ncbi:uncharacterized protein EAF01_006593 [Botrytis porri]|uniref:uncharacterized protein n=1 Tax=Botrytis porri TaxID=87229 RepID=UPI0019008B88|nr:uncharacterized protein EAF01_006593 [Botrytis porri]KAF7903544.1 hypothetical protein EAF01_006593 [Botrytis porri]
MIYPILLSVLTPHAVTILIAVAPRAYCDSSATLHNHMFATSNVNFPMSILPTVYLPNSTTLFPPIAIHRPMAESLEPLEMLSDESPVIPFTNSSSSSSGTSTYFAFVINPLPPSKRSEVTGHDERAGNSEIPGSEFNDDDKCPDSLSDRLSK